jgi:hypothetical protein
MPKPRGSPKTGGRQKGTPNKRTREFEEILEESGFCPARALIRTYRKAWKHFEKADIVFDAILEAAGDGSPITPAQVNALARQDILGYLKTAQAAAAELMAYRYPKRKAIELSGKDGGPLDLYLRMTPEERERQRAELAKRLGKK